MCVGGVNKITGKGKNTGKETVFVGKTMYE